MPITVKDYTWKETESDVSITLPLKGVKSSKADIFSTDQYIKVNYPPYLFEVHLHGIVIEEQSTAKIGNGVVDFRLIKKGPGVWGRLASVESDDRTFMVERRAEALEHAHKAAAKLAEEKAKKKREEEQFAIKQQMKLEEEERERIAREKQEERDKAERELEQWKEEKRRRERAQELKRVAASKKKQTSSIWKEKNSVTVPPRKGGSIQVRFTPRAFPTAARESKEEEEQEYLAKMAAARRIKPPEKDGEGINERNPEFLKDKGVEFFKARNYEAAMNAFSEAIQLNPNLPYLFSNRAACYLAVGNNEGCIHDCCRALELFFPIVPSNYASRAKAFVRRGTAYANVGRVDLALQDYDAALKLSPSDEKLKEDYGRLKLAMLNDTS